VPDTAAPAETTVTHTTAVSTESAMTVQTYAAVTEADPSEFQHRNYSGGTADPNEEEQTLPTVVTVRPTVSTTRSTTRRTTAQTTRGTAGTGAETAKSTTTTTTTTTTTVPLSGRQAEMKKLVRSYKRTCAVLMTAQDGTVLFSYQPDKAISGASLIKLPYVYFCCVQLSGGVRSLTDSVTYTADWYHGGSGIIRKNGYGKTYTVAQLMDYALRYSDNVAYDMLVYLFGIKGFDDMVQSWGYSVSISASRFPPVTAAFMTAAMTKMQAASALGGCWQIAWDALTGSVQSYVRDTLGISGMAVKYG
jgi:beta-lactamase class A